MLRRVFVLILTGLVFPPTGIAVGQDVKTEIEVVAQTSDEGIWIVVKNLPKPEVAQIAVWVDGIDIAENPPVLGSTSIDRGLLVFKPRFPLQPGTKYDVQLQVQPRGKPTTFVIGVPQSVSAKSKVVAIYPSSNRLSENILKFYVHFSAPMRKGNIYRYVRIRETGGKEIELPFLEIEQEFWSRDSKRLTLLLDPGRIKRGLKPREEMGPILVAGSSYELVVDGNWPDSVGKLLGADFVKKFEAVETDDTQPDPKRWNVSAPVAGTMNPLVISFAGSIDHSMLFRSINIVDSSSQPVEGTITVSHQETRWAFTPNRSWTGGRFKIVVDQDLEDNVGNSIGRKFDVDLFEKTESPTPQSAVELEFVVAK